MALFGPIPQYDINQNFSDIANLLMKNKENAALMEQKKYDSMQNQLEQKEKIRQFNESLAETSRYHKSMEGNQNLKNDLLKAKIESEKELSNQRKNKGSKENDFLTTANKTKNESIIQSIDSVLPLIKKIDPKTAPGQTLGKYFSPNLQAKYAGQTAAITDTLIGALGLPKTDSSIHLVNKMVIRGPGESDDAYKKRLEGLVSDLKSRKENSIKSMQSGVMNTAINEHEMEGEEPEENTIWMIRPDNVKVPVHTENIDQAIDLGYKKVE